MISEQTRPSSVTLTATNKFGSTFRYELGPEQGVFVGKSSNCGLQLEGHELSDIQCRIGFEDGELWVHPWMSAEGTRVNGQPIDSSLQVSIGDTVEMGDHKIVIGDDDPTVKTPVSTGPAQEILGPAGSAELSSIIDEIVPDAVSDTEVTSEPEESCPVSEVELDESCHEVSPDVGDEPQSMDFGSDFFDLEEEETYDRETVALLQAEIEDLQAQLAQRDADQSQERFEQDVATVRTPEDSDEVLHRMQELIDEANRSDERVALLEEMLHAAEDASRSESEERNQLEAWVGDIEKRIGQREEEHTAELETLRNRLEESQELQERLQRQLRQAAAAGGAAPKQYEETLENLQQSNQRLQQELGDTQKQCRSLQKQIDEKSEDTEAALRSERAKIAQEQAKISRLRFELSSKLTEIEEAPATTVNQADRETAHRIQTLRQHLREIHEQEKKEEKEASLTTRLAKLWKRVEY